MPCNGSGWNGKENCEGCPQCRGREKDEKKDKELQDKRKVKK